MMPITKQETELLKQFRALPQEKQAQFQSYVVSLLYRQLTAAPAQTDETPGGKQPQSEVCAKR